MADLRLMSPERVSAVIGLTAPQVLTIEETSTILRCSKAHVQNLLAGRVAGAPPLPYLPLGRRKLILRESLLHYMQAIETTER
jgi:hypothetical protein